MNTVAPYPLYWPEYVARTKPSSRLRSPFRSDFRTAIDNVTKSLRLFQKEAGVEIAHVILSSNVDLLCQNPDDPGAVAWFVMDHQWVAFGVDRFQTVEANIQAIHHIIEARRVELRYGGLAIVRQTFKSFVALPAPPNSQWWEVLGIDRFAPRAEILTAFKELAARHHPDVGGSHDIMVTIIKARDDALRISADKG